MKKKMLYCTEQSVPVWVVPIITKLSLVGMQLPENIRRNSTFPAKALRVGKLPSTSLGTSNLSLYLSGNCIPTNESVVFIVLAKCFLKIFIDIQYSSF